MSSRWPYNLSSKLGPFQNERTLVFVPGQWEIGTVPNQPGYIVTLVIKDPRRQQGRQGAYSYLANYIK